MNATAKIPLPAFPPTSSGTKCYQLRVYKYRMAYEVGYQTGIWQTEDKWGAGYWHFKHSSECLKSKQRCLAGGWMYWEGGDTEDVARRRLMVYLERVLKPRMEERFAEVMQHLVFV